jgi:hypothetical protein
MIEKFLNPPVLYLLITLIVIILSLIYIKREWISSEIKNWQAKEVKAGLLTFSRESSEKRGSNDKQTSSVIIGGGESQINHTIISNVAGRDIISSTSPISTNDSKTSSSVIIGDKKAKMEGVDIDNVSGRDIIDKKTHD